MNELKNKEYVVIMVYNDIGVTRFQEFLNKKYEIERCDIANSDRGQIIYVLSKEISTN